MNTKKTIKDYRNESFNVSERFFELFFEKREENDGYLEVFNNCREQGYLFVTHRGGRLIYDTLWVYENRNSDSIVVALGHNSEREDYGMFNDNVYSRRQFFVCGEYEKAVDYALKHLGKPMDVLNLLGNVDKHKILQQSVIVKTLDEALQTHILNNQRNGKGELETKNPTIIFEGRKPVFYILNPENKIKPWEDSENPFLTEDFYIAFWEEKKEGF